MVTQLKLQQDKSVSTRLMGAVLYRLYPIMEKYLKDKALWTEGARLGSTGHPRKFCFTNDDHECFVFWEVRVEDSREVTFKPREGLEKVGPSSEAAEAMCKQAIKEAKAQSRE